MFLLTNFQKAVHKDLHDIDTSLENITTQSIIVNWKCILNSLKY